MKQTETTIRTEHFNCFDGYAEVIEICTFNDITKEHVFDYRIEMTIERTKIFDDTFETKTEAYKKCNMIVKAFENFCPE